MRASIAEYPKHLWARNACVVVWCYSGAPTAASWAEQSWQELHASSAGGGYVNMMMEDDGRDRVRAAYRGNYDRLVEVKRRYDPTNLFHINHNIPPIPISNSA